MSQSTPPTTSLKDFHLITHYHLISLPITLTENILTLCTHYTHYLTYNHKYYQSIRNNINRYPISEWLYRLLRDLFSTEGQSIRYLTEILYLILTPDPLAHPKHLITHIRHI